ncbi:septum formation inhibitor Maf [Jeotgalibacillus sp. S-D1]|uniref:Maf family protein n=1 Tax=Jeotgalibacillus sp. S-D1 TaxID=2552189 RepID=UPI0010599030|nr:Maf family protein [Jeotgalibacillus sp. S-D1]TDL34408.1 septum formation inhibitor Maf [Jeotgalibacillus sp. S-D1]
MTEIILASASPRRKELLSYLNLPFKVQPSSFEELFSPADVPEEVVLRLAKGKAADVAQQYPDAAVIGCDTIVVCEQILGKPRNEKEAELMLNQLSDRTHTVWTGVSILYGKKRVEFVERTEVTFWPLTQKDIQAYIKSGDCFDKAGAYGIQSGGALFVRKIHGDYYSVVGLPVARLKREIAPLLSI